MDIASYQTSGAGIDVDLASGSAAGGDAEGDTLTNVESIVGSLHDDALGGNDSANLLQGGGGDDRLTGRGGGDYLHGGDGRDTVVYTDSGAAVTISLQSLWGGAFGGDAQGDRLFSIKNVVGSAYADTITGDDGNNIIEGGAGGDWLDGGSGTGNTVSYAGSTAGVSVDLVSYAVSGGHADGDSIRNFDNVEGSTHHDNISGSQDDNLLDGLAGNDLLEGLLGSDIVRGGAGNDVLSGNEGDDVVEGGAGADQLSGDDGFDTVSYASSDAAVSVDLGTGAVSGGHADGDTLSTFENITGSAYGDILTGDAGDNVLEGGLGGDVLDGGAGIDTASYRRSGRGVQIDLGRGGGLSYSEISGRFSDISDRSNGTIQVSGTQVLHQSDQSVTYTEATAESFGWNVFTINQEPNVQAGANYESGLLMTEIHFVADNEIIPEGFAYIHVDTGSVSTGDRVTIVSQNGTKQYIDMFNGLELPSDISLAYNRFTGEVTFFLNGAFAGGVKWDKDLDVMAGSHGSVGMVATLVSDVDLIQALDLSSDESINETLVAIENVVGSDYGDHLTGDAGDNELTGAGGADRLDGAAGLDTAIFAGHVKDYQLEVDQETGNVSLRDLQPDDGDDGVDLLVDIEKIRFLGGETPVEIDITGDPAVDNAPVARDGRVVVSVDHGVVSGTFSGYDIDDDALTFALDAGLAADPANPGWYRTDYGRVRLTDAAMGAYEYLADAGHEGTDNIAFTVSDGVSNDTGTVSVQTHDDGLIATGEIKVNASTVTLPASRVPYPAVTPLKDGGHVVVWDRVDETTGGRVLMGRRYDASGTPLSGEFTIRVADIVPTPPSLSPEVEALSDGGFVVVWEAYTSNGGQYNTNNWREIYSQRFDASGTKVGGEAMVNTTLSGNQFEFSVVSLAGGGYVVAWETDANANQDGSGSATYGRVFGADGAAMSGEILLNGTTYQNQTAPDLAALADGGFVATWLSAPNGLHEVMVRHFDAAGVPLGAEVRVNTDTQVRHINPSVAVLEDGGVVVVWWSARADGNFEVRGQRLDASGNVVGAEFAVDAQTWVATSDAEQNEAEVVALPGGGFAVAWLSQDAQSGTKDIYARRFDGAGAAVGESFRLSSDAPQEALRPRIEATADGGLVAAWWLEDGSGNGDVYSRIYTPAAFEGTAGADILVGGTDDDTLSGHGGDDMLIGGAGADLLFGGIGTDTASYAASGAGVTVDLSAGTGAGGDAEGDRLESMEDVDGSAFDDTIRGNDKKNVLSGDEGDDVLEGRGGADVLRGGAGSDTASYASSLDGVDVDLGRGGGIRYVDLGGAVSANRQTGNVTSLGSIATHGPGASVAYSDATGDADGWIVATVRHDASGLTVTPYDSGVIIAAAHSIGAAEIRPDGAAAYAYVYTGTDAAKKGVTVHNADGTVSAQLDYFRNLKAVEEIGFAYNRSTGQLRFYRNGWLVGMHDWVAGLDLMVGSEGAEGMVATFRDDADLKGALGLGGDDAVNDTFDSIENVTGSEFADRLTGDSGANVLSGGAGHDILSGAGGADTLDGGSGQDTATYSDSSVGVTVDLTAGTASDGDALTDIENVVGSAHADTLIGSSASNVLDGGDGIDTAVFAGAAGGYLIEGNATDGYEVTDLDPSDGDDGADSLTGIERLQFADRTLDLTTGANAPVARTGQVTVPVDHGVVSGTFSGYDVDGDALSFALDPALAADPANPGWFRTAYGRVRITDAATGSYEYLADAGYQGADAIGFSVSDGVSSDANTVSVEVFSIATHIVPTIGGGPVSRVHQQWTGPQARPSVAAFEDGSYILVWGSSGQDGSDWGVYGRRFGGDGAPLGDEFRINTYTTNGQEKPAVAVLSDGGFVVTWVSEGQDGSGTGISGQRYAADGTAVGSEFRVNGFNTHDQMDPSVTGLADGGFIVAWESALQDGDGWGIYGQRFDGSGAKVFGDFLINATMAGDQQHAAVAALSGGSYVAAWTSSVQDADGSAGVYSRILTPADFVRTGTAGDDVLAGTPGYDALAGYGGDDVLTGGTAADTLDGGLGSDTVSYAGSTTGITVDLAAGTASDGDTLISIESVTGSVHNDTLTGSSKDNTLTGGAGHDVLDGGAGADTLDGGGGVDTVTYARSTAGVEVDLSAGTGLYGDASGDTLSGIENVIGSSFNDTLAGNHGANVLDGGAGTDTVSYAGAASGVSVDLAAGTASDGDTLVSIENVVGSDYADTLIGTSANNTLDGGVGTDTAVFSNAAGDYLIEGDAASGYTVTDLDPTNGDDGTDTLTGIERLQFSDQTLDLTSGANAPVARDAVLALSADHDPVVFRPSGYDVWPAPIEWSTV